MKVSAWRILKAKYQDEPLCGEGARRVGGRWNPKGTPLVYLADSVALAMLEVLVHLRDSDTLAKYALAKVSFDSTLVQELRHENLPADWRVFPHPLSTKEIGRQWTASQSSALLKVPSSVSPRDANYLLNPQHPDLSEVEVGEVSALSFDPRLFA